MLPAYRFSGLGLLFGLLLGLGDRGCCRLGRDGRHLVAIGVDLRALTLPAAVTSSACDGGFRMYRALHRILFQVHQGGAMGWVWPVWHAGAVQQLVRWIGLLYLDQGHIRTRSISSCYFIVRNMLRHVRGLFQAFLSHFQCRLRAFLIHFQSLFRAVGRLHLPYQAPGPMVLLQRGQRGVVDWWAGVHQADQDSRQPSVGGMC